MRHIAGRELTLAKWNQIKSCNHRGKEVKGVVSAHFPGGYKLRLGGAGMSIGHLREHEVEWAFRHEYIETARLEIGRSVCAVVEEYDNDEWCLELSLKKLYAGPLLKFFEIKKLGDIVCGSITRFVSSGAFVDLDKGATGFLPCAEIPEWENDGDSRVERLLQKGDRIAAIIIGKSSETIRLELSIRALRDRGPSYIQFTTGIAMERNEGRPFLADTVCLQVPMSPKPRTVVVLEDNVIAREESAAFLAEAGHKVYPVSTIDELQELFQNRAIDCIVADVAMADGNSAVPMVIRLLKSHPRTKVLFVAAGCGNEDLAAIRSANGQVLDALMKPVSFVEIAKTLNRFRPAKQFEIERYIHISQPEADHPFFYSQESVAPEISEHQALADTWNRIIHLFPECGVVIFRKGQDVSSSEIAKIHGIPLARLIALQYRWEFSPIGDVLRDGISVIETNLDYNNQGSCGELLRHLPFRALIGFPVSIHGVVRYGLFVFSWQALAFDAMKLEQCQLCVDRFCFSLVEVMHFDKVARQHARLSASDFLSKVSHETANALHNMDTPLDNMHRLLYASLSSRLSAADMRELTAQLGCVKEAYYTVKSVFKMFLGMTSDAQVRLINIYDLIVDLVHFFQSESARRKITLQYDLEPKLKLCEYHEGPVRQALCNLILNALQHSRSGGMVLVRGSIDNDREHRVAIRVFDTGAGIHFHDYQNIFHSGFTTRLDGTGLGLQIARNLIARLGGELVLEDSRVFYGTVFTIYLPKSE